MSTPEFICWSDAMKRGWKNDDGNVFHWHWCYLHGAAEQHMQQYATEDCDSAPDIFVSDSPAPQFPGKYPFRLYGRDGIMVVDWRRRSRRQSDAGGPGDHLCGRGYLVDDPERRNIEHCNTVTEWM